jgi:hypothetical protein
MTLIGLFGIFYFNLGVFQSHFGLITLFNKYCLIIPHGTLYVLLNTKNILH